MDYSSGEWQEFETTGYTMATGLKEILTNDQDQQQQYLYQNANIPTETQDFYLQQRARIGQTLRLTTTEKQRIYVNVRT